MIMLAASATNSVRLSLGAYTLWADQSGALFEPQSESLIIADCHFEKASALTRQGHVVPPFDTRDTLLRLKTIIAHYQPRQLIALGDSFHDRTADKRLSDDDRALLLHLTEQCAWIWVAGNHDPEPIFNLPGQSVTEIALGDIVLCHEPTTEKRLEIAGHLHPAAKISGRGRSVRRRCFVSNAQRCIMPAFGAYAGGLNVLDEAFTPFFERDSWRIHAIGRDRLYAIAPTLLIED